MKLWDKGKSTDAKVDQFTVGNDRELDLILAKYDVQASKAHAKMLGKIGMLKEDETDKLINELNTIEKDIESGDFSIEQEFEDMHSKIEFLLIQKLGETGKKIHTARSRNDQVLVALQLYLKNEIIEIKGLISELFQTLTALAEKYKKVLLPGYTHLQIAMPSSFGLWLSAYAETLIDDVYFLNAAYKVTDQNPLGSAAGYGSSFPIDRDATTKELNFKTLKYNSISAQMGRGKVEKLSIYALASLCSTLSKLSMDVTLYMGQNFGFLSFPDEITTGSSIMPHKKNPDVFELIRAKCNSIQGMANQVTLIVNNLPSGYHRDFQVTKEIIVKAIQECKACLEMTTASISQLQVKKDILEDPRYDYLFSVERLNELVLQGMTFRDAYKEVAKEIEKGSFQPNRELSHSHIGSIGNLCLGEIQSKMAAAMK